MSTDSGSVVQAQWSLDQTSQSMVGIARGILQAATTNNVQVLAIVACERFGATLAIYSETRLTIEREILPTPESAVISFLKLTVGYNANDCVTQLGKSLAGVQFLALATALLSTMDYFSAATAIQEMLVNTAMDKALIPTVRQVQDLLTSIEPRCLRTRFGDSVFGWTTLLQESPHAYFGAPYQRLQDMHPESQVISSLVDAFRQLRRVGNADVTGVTITTPIRGASWIIAFTKWCLGAPPTIVFDDGKLFLQKDGSGVIIILARNGDASVMWENFQVSIHSSINDLSELVDSDIVDTVKGMLDVPTFGKRFLQLHNFDVDLRKKALQQAIFSGLGQLIQRLIVIPQRDEYPPLDESISYDAKGPRSESEKTILESRLSPFAKLEVICRSIFKLFGSLEQRPVTELGDSYQIYDLPDVTLCLKQIEQECVCKTCKPILEENRLVRHECEKEFFFWESLSSIFACILSLSLFQNLDTLLVHYRPWKVSDDQSQGLENAIQLVIEKGVYAHCSVTDVMQSALDHVGHIDTSTLKIREGGSILTCFKGQAVWPVAYETCRLAQRGYLSLAWLPGSISHRGETYNVVDGTRYNGDYPGVDSITNGPEEPVTRLYKIKDRDIRFQWTISPRSSLTLWATLSSMSSQYASFDFDIGTFFSKLSTAVFIGKCGHLADAVLAAADEAAAYSGPYEPYRQASHEGGNHFIDVVAVDGSDELRFLAIAALRPLGRKPPPSVVIRKGACLSCCLNFCRDIGFKVLIL